MLVIFRWVDFVVFLVLWVLCRFSVVVDIVV